MTPWWLLLLGCPRQAGPEAAAALPALTWDELFVAARYDYVEISVTDGGAPVRTTVTEQWTREEGVDPPEGFPGEVWAVDDSPEEGPTVRTLFVAGPSGLAYFRTVGPHGSVRDFGPKVLLPPRLTGETRWVGTHGAGQEANTRSCAVEPTPYCEAGAAVTCDTRWAGRSVWMRQHFCRGEGWVGYESILEGGGHRTLTWSEEATRDGVALPLVGFEQRPLPEGALPAGAAP